MNENLEFVTFTYTSLILLLVLGDSWELPCDIYLISKSRVRMLHDAMMLKTAICVSVNGMS